MDPDGGRLNKNFDDDEDMRMYAQMMAQGSPSAPPPAASPSGNSGFTIPVQEPQRTRAESMTYGSTTTTTTGNNNNNNNDRATEEDILAHYAAMSAQSGVSPAVASSSSGGGQQQMGYNEYAYPKDFDAIDKRFGGLKFAVLSPDVKKMFGEKIGALCYFYDKVKLYFKGFFGSSAEEYFVFLCPLAIYFAHPKGAKITVARAYSQITMVNVLGDQGVAIRANKVPDVFFKFIAPGSTARNALVDVMRQLYGASGEKLNTITGSSDREASYRKEINYLEEKEHQWGPHLREDPRTGLALVEVPDLHKQHYEPLIPKILHWFGGVNQTLLGGRNEIVSQRRGCWITATTLYLCNPMGPQPDGRDITRCVGIEYIKCVLDGQKAGVLGLVIGSGPKQADLALTFDSEAVKKKIIFILERIYAFRTNGPMFVRPVDSLLNAGIKLANEKGFKPELFRMKTREDLYCLLRG